MPLQQNFNSRIVNVHWVGGNWIAFYFEVNSYQAGDVREEYLMKDINFYPNHEIKLVDYPLKISVGATPEPAIKHPLSAEMRSKLLIWNVEPIIEEKPDPDETDGSSTYTIKGCIFINTGLAQRELLKILDPSHTNTSAVKAAASKLKFTIVLPAERENADTVDPGSGLVYVVKPSQPWGGTNPYVGVDYDTVHWEDGQELMPSGPVTTSRAAYIISNEMSKYNNIVYSYQAMNAAMTSSLRKEYVDGGPVWHWAWKDVNGGDHRDAVGWGGPADSSDLDHPKPLPYDIDSFVHVEDFTYITRAYEGSSTPRSFYKPRYWTIDIGLYGKLDKPQDLDVDDDNYPDIAGKRYDDQNYLSDSPSYFDQTKAFKSTEHTIAVTVDLKAKTLTGDLQPPLPGGDDESEEG